VLVLRARQERPKPPRVPGRGYLSKKHGQRRKRRNRRLAAKARQGDVLLRSLAAALNDIEHAGQKVRFSHGVVFTWEGYLMRKKGGWQVITLPVHPAADVDPLSDED